MKSLKKIVLLGTILFGLVGCNRDNNQVRKVGDFTGDGILDVMTTGTAVDFGGSSFDQDYLFIGRGDGTFIKSVGVKVGNREVFKTADRQVYVFNGTNYILVK